jgi:hypothetical protein
MSRLEDLSVAFRNEQIMKNDYNANDPYTSSHSDALSNGDELGKDELNGSVGGLTDIKTRKSLLIKNKFTSNNEYNSSNA